MFASLPRIAKIHQIILALWIAKLLICTVLLRTSHDQESLLESNGVRRVPGSNVTSTTVASSPTRNVCNGFGVTVAISPILIVLGTGFEGSIDDPEEMAKLIRIVRGFFSGCFVDYQITEPPLPKAAQDLDN